MIDQAERAKILIEALPYIQRFNGSTMVIKYGGSAMINEELKNNFALDVILMKYVGINPIIVHGGGPQIGELLRRLNIQTRFVEGFRVTDEQVMDVVEMVLVGKVNKEIVNLINKNKGQAVGLSGKDGGLFVARKMKYIRQRSADEPPEELDIGLVGEIVSVNTKVLETLTRDGFIPVIAPVGADESGQTYNINADTVAGDIAAALKARKLILLTDTKGVLDKDGNLISSLKLNEARQLIADGTVTGGMIPKLNCCIKALEGGVKKAHIIDGRQKHAILLEVFTKGGVGTEIIN
ncbi:MAG: acetylglutamate kinase [Deltaproteobacteria bacterium]|nr:MAG: acetylglutamate kinase [Deltaproteobacteria bacterium]